MSDNSEVMSADVVLVGAGIMSTTLAVFLKELQPHLRIEIHIENASLGGHAAIELSVWKQDNVLADRAEFQKCRDLFGPM